jgi:hypothetical protein
MEAMHATMLQMQASMAEQKEKADKQEKELAELKAKARKNQRYESPTPTTEEDTRGSRERTPKR